MNTKLTLDKKIHSRKLTLPPTWLYMPLMWVIKILNMKTKTEFTYKAYPGKEDDPIVMIANHSSRVEYQFTAPCCLPKKLNFVVGYNEFF